MLRPTGHPFFDVGAATVAAFNGRTRVEDVTRADLEAFAAYVVENYVVNPLKTFLGVPFHNAGYSQVAFETQPERRVNYARRATSLAADENNPLRCVFTGEPVTAEWLSSKELTDADKRTYPSGRAFRHNVPMLIGEGMINFHPGGDPGLPISGAAMLCMQALPMGCAKIGGRLFAVHSDDPAVTLRFARQFLASNRRRVDLARAANESKLAEDGHTPRTVLIETLLKIDAGMQEAREDENPYSVTAYHFSNSGRSNPLDTRNPPMELYTMPYELIRFIGSMRNPLYRDAWRAIAQRGWMWPKQAKRTTKKKDVSAAEPATNANDVKQPAQRNFLYEDLFALPDNAARFVRCYLLRIPRQNTFEDDPRRAYSLRDEASLVSWSITELFLAQVLHMNERRIQTIRDMADRLADYIHAENDKAFFTKFYSVAYYDGLRNAIIRVSEALVKRGKPPLVEFDSYIAVFEEPDYDRSSGSQRNSWKLARDLMLIRIIERLYHHKWLQGNLDAIPETREPAPEATPTESDE
jgi:CRISPR-associated protein Cst1